QIAYVAHNFRNPMFVDEMGIVGFLNEPYVALGQALLLKFKPANMDVLPLYIALLLVFPVILWGLYKNSTVVLGLSALLYFLQWYFDWNLPSYPDDKGWFFNPFAWQLLFVFGALCGRWRGTPLWPWLPARAALIAAVTYILFAFFIVMTWHFPRLAVAVPTWLAQILYPIDKTDLDLLRLFNFLALAYVTVRFVSADSAFLHWRVSAPLVRCGQHSLHVFCLGIFLSFAGHFVLTEISRGTLAQIAVNAVGVGLMIAMAYLLTWYKSADAVPKPVAASPQRSEAT
ncbi:MAG: OpgC domain-containing protein, partial [Candidatus Eiseniibacteriota bacterium]